MKPFHLTVSSPEGAIFSDDVMFVSLRGTEGEFAVMADHVPFVTAVVPCECKVILADETEKTGTTDGGILTVASTGVTFLSGSFVWK